MPIKLNPFIATALKDYSIEQVVDDGTLQECQEVIPGEDER